MRSGFLLSMVFERWIGTDSIFGADFGDPDWAIRLY